MADSKDLDPAAGPQSATTGPDQASAGPSPGEGKAKAVSPKIGAPRGNKNRLVHGLRSARPASELRDTESRNAERAVLDVLRAYGLEKDPLGKLVGRQLRRLETAALRMERRFAQRGMTDNKGKPKEGVQTFLTVVQQLLSQSKALLDQLRELRAASGTGNPVLSAERLAIVIDGQCPVTAALSGPACGVCGAPSAAWTDATFAEKHKTEVEKIEAAAPAPETRQEPAGAAPPSSPPDAPPDREKRPRRPPAASAPQCSVGGGEPRVVPFPRFQN